MSYGHNEPAMLTPVEFASADIKPAILFISPVEPNEAGNGIEKRAWCHLEALAKKADVHLLVAMTRQQDHRAIAWPRLREICKTAELTLLDETSKVRPSSSAPVLLARKLAGLRSAPFRLAIDGLERVAQQLRGTGYDLVFCFRMRSFRVLELLQQCAPVKAERLYVDFDDIESVATWREIPHLRRSIGRVKTILSRLEALELWLLERRILSEADAVSVCSSIDRTKLQKRSRKAKINVVPNSYSLMEKLPLRREGQRPAEILFLGTMAYPPNVDAILYFYRLVLPLILKQFPHDIRLNVVGLRPVPSVKALSKNPIVNVTVGVESVVPYYERADIVIAPIRFGGGTRIKILEALSYGRPVVSTTIGAEGLDLTPGRDLLIADQPQEFADSCVALLQNEEQRRHLVENGWKRVAELYDRPKVQTQLLESLFPD